MAVDEKKLAELRAALSEAEAALNGLDDNASPETRKAAEDHKTAAEKALGDAKLEGQRRAEEAKRLELRKAEAVKTAAAKKAEAEASAKAEDASEDSEPEPEAEPEKTEPKAASKAVVAPRLSVQEQNQAQSRQNLWGMHDLSPEAQAARRNPKQT